MADSDGFLKSKKIQRTKILPLRWIGNYLGGIAGNSLVKAFDLDEDGDFDTALNSIVRFGII